MSLESRHSNWWVVGRASGNGINDLYLLLISFLSRDVILRTARTVRGNVRTHAPPTQTKGHHRGKQHRSFSSTASARHALVRSLTPTAPALRMTVVTLLH
jgi:hypothetical protein